MSEEIKIIVNIDGTIEIDQIGWEGSSCSGKIDDLIKDLGIETLKRKKLEYYHGHRTVKQKRRNIREQRR